jgi:ankyrin repeat protein
MDVMDEEAAVAEILINHGADPNSVKFHYGATPLQLAALYGRESLVSALLEKGANPFLERELGYTACQLANARNYTTVVRLLEEKWKNLCRKKRQR